MVFSSAAIVTVAEVSVETWQRLMRIPSSEMLNTQQILSLPLSHFVLHLWEFLCFSPLSDSDDSLSSSSSDDDDDDDVFSFDEISYGDSEDHDHRPSSSSSTLDFDYYYHYSRSD